MARARAENENVSIYDNEEAEKEGCIFPQARFEFQDQERMRMRGNEMGSPLPSFLVAHYSQQQPDFLALKQESRILGHSSDPLCGFSMMQQVMLCAVWPMENWLGSYLYHIQGWTTVRGFYSHALEPGSLAAAAESIYLQLASHVAQLPMVLRVRHSRDLRGNRPWLFSFFVATSEIAFSNILRLLLR